MLGVDLSVSPGLFWDQVIVSDNHQNSGRSTFKSLILALIVKGKAKQMLRGNKTLTVTPDGHDSVEGMVDDDLNYDET